MQNPYLNRSMIRSVGEFFGREQEIERIAGRLGAAVPQSVSLVGERRAGKSSLLWYISQPEIYASRLANAERYVFIFIDFQGLRHLDQEGFCRVFGQHLTEAAGQRLRVGELNGLSDLERAAHQLDRAGLQLVCLFDEFEVVTCSAAFGAEFYGILRSLANLHNVAYITASRRPLPSLCHSQEISASPFFNIFTATHIGPLSDEEAHRLIAEPSAAAGAPLAASADEILRLSGNLPFFIQIACSNAVEQGTAADGGQLDRNRLAASFLTEARDHFSYQWTKLTPKERRALRGLAAGEKPDLETAEALAALLDDGYVVRSEGSGLSVFSSQFGRFINEKPEEGFSDEVAGSSAGPASPAQGTRSRWRPASVWAALAAVAAAAIFLWRSPGADEDGLASSGAEKPYVEDRSQVSPETGAEGQGAVGPRTVEQGAVGRAVPLRLAELQVHDLYASFYRSYARQPLGSAVVHNDGSDSVAATVSLFIPGRMRRPTEWEVNVAPGERRQVALNAHLAPEILNLEEPAQVRVEVGLKIGSEPAFLEEGRDVVLHGRGALVWDDVRRAAAFVTAGDPAVEAFAHSVLLAFEEEIGSLGRPGRNLMKAMVLFEALGAHGVRYVEDANSPYAQVSAKRSVVDHIKYPAEVLAERTGDCDDLTVLYCSVLENAGVQTALVDYPKHIFMMFDTGISRRLAYKLPLDEGAYVVRGERLWIPVEITLIGKPFEEAWHGGTEEVAGLSTRDRQRLVVDTASAWERYEPAAPRFEITRPPPRRSELDSSLAAQYGRLTARIDEHIGKTYLAPLKESGGRENIALWSELSRVYASLTRYDEAIQSAYARLVDLGGSDANVFNHLGISYFLKGEVQKAAFYFRQAAELDPDKPGYQRNYGRAMAALGKAEPLPRERQADTPKTGEGVKSADMSVDEESFYWTE